MTLNTDVQKRILDVTTDTCPMTYVRTRLALERLFPRDIRQVLVRGEEPLANIPRMAENQGHIVLSKTLSLSDSSIMIIEIERGARA